MRRSCFALCAMLAVSSSVAVAQVPDSSRPPRPMRGVPGQGRGRMGQPPERRALEADAQRALANAIRRQLNLDDQKMRRLQETNGKYENERRTLLRDERDARQSLRAALEDSTSSDDAKIESALSRMIQIQRQRVELLEQEQKDLSAFLSAKQRAQFFSLRERLARRLLEFEQGSPPGGRRGIPPR